MRALQIEFDVNTGKRAGDVWGPRGHRDPNLFCYPGWQNLDSVPAVEIRAILDDRDVSQYENIMGVTVLHDDAEIDAAVDALMPVRVSIQDETLFKLDMEQRNLKLENIPGEQREEVLRHLKQRGVKGIVERRPAKTKEIVK